ncbi:ubiquinone biosynthesis protein UbiJ [Methylomarinovum tepidoasis]|uniref:Ubiquinone biosynthesis accessory factor UbiJ n=1 Tax=Methylomarinovum tepidoasis TaxID=2840183 RepID=A0AAU9CNV7_9GAMM|nr:SCP2 sterol-binding domain-containing protein [Methylomarinovum sp. IN45]BCX87963.1 ubiquinone biosynthesis protein UbiJ [Methylomarinovum sp. IN45]
MLARALASQTLEAAVARLLALDPRASRLLEPLAGKIIVVELRPFPLRFCFSPTDETVLVLAESPSDPEVILRGTPFGFLRLLLAERPETGLFQGAVQVEGDMDTAKRLQNLLRRLDLDWERWLTDLAGERPADLLRGVVAWHRHAWRSFQWNLADFLQEETRVLPAPLEAENLYRQIGALRDDVERLEARIRRLQEKRTA